MDTVLDVGKAVVTLLLPSFVAAGLAYARRTRFIVVGFRHQCEASFKHRFNIHYAEDYELKSKVTIKIRLRGGNFQGEPVLRTAPGGTQEKKPTSNGYEITLDGPRAKTTWVLEFETVESGEPAEVIVEHGLSSTLPVRDKASYLHPKRSLPRFLPSPLFFWTLLLTATLYAATTNIRVLDDFRPLRWLRLAGDDPTVTLLVRPDLRDLPVELISASGLLVAFIVAYQICVKRGEVHVSHGYLGWHPGVIDGDAGFPANSAAPPPATAQGDEPAVPRPPDQRGDSPWQEEADPPADG